MISQPSPEAAVVQALRSMLCQRRPLPCGDILFVETRQARAELACLVEQNTPDLDRAPQADEAQDRHGAGETPPAGAFEELQHWCGQCRAVLPSAHLLDLHLSEVHDSFFAAQAARGMRVYVCLVEGCPYRSASVTERRAHLLEQHGISDALDLNVVHLRRAKPQTKPGKIARRKGQRRSGEDAASAEAAMDVDGA